MDVANMDEIEFPSDNVRSKNIQKIVYYPNLSEISIFHNNKAINFKVDLSSMTKTAQNYDLVFDGQVDIDTKNEISYIISNGIAPYMLQFVKDGGVYNSGSSEGNTCHNEDGLTDQYAEALNNANRAIPKFPEDELAEILNRDYSGFVINTSKKEVKRDDVLIRQVFYTGISTYTFDPINLGIISPTSEGKTYTTMKVMQYFPKEDVWVIGQMSDKALIRQKGITINSKGESIQEQIDKLRIELRDTTTVTIRLEPPEKAPTDAEGKPIPVSERVKMKKAEIKSKLDTLLDDAITLIDLQGKILLFLEPPQKELWNLIKPILSHDKVEITYDYVDRTEKGGLLTRRVIVRGYPACIFCSAKDESKWEVWDEIQSRFLITSPNMNQDKVHDGNVLIAQRKGLPNAIQQQVIVSDKERILAKKSVSFLKGWMHRLFQSNMLDYDHPNAVWIPYNYILADALKSDRGTDNRITNRIFSLLNIIPLTKVHHRQTLVFGNERSVIATLEDLSETLHITQNLSGIPPHKLRFHKEYFLPLYESKTEPDRKEDKPEDRIGVTTSQLRDYYKSKTGKSITTVNIINTYLNELENNGFIDKQDSAIDKRQKIYFPIMEIPKEQKIKKLLSEKAISNFLEHNKIIPSKYLIKIHKNWLEVEISALKRYLVDNDTFQIIDENDNEISILRFVKNYSKEGNLTNYFVKPNSSNNYNGITEGMKLLYGDDLE
jgi:hypothetical protein